MREKLAKKEKQRKKEGGKGCPEPVALSSSLRGYAVRSCLPKSAPKLDLVGGLFFLPARRAHTLVKNRRVHGGSLLRGEGRQRNPCGLTLPPCLFGGCVRAFTSAVVVAAQEEGIGGCESESEEQKGGARWLVWLPAALPRHPVASLSQARAGVC